MDAKRFFTMRIGIAVLASLWLVVHCASVVESHGFWTQVVADDHPNEDAPWSDDAEGERSDADETDEEREDEVKVLVSGGMGSVGQRTAASTLHEPGVVPERAGHGLPPTPPPRRS